MPGVEPSSPVYKTGASPSKLQRLVWKRGFAPRLHDPKSCVLLFTLYPVNGLRYKPLTLAVGEGVEPPTLLRVTVFKTAWYANTRPTVGGLKHVCPRQRLDPHKRDSVLSCNLPWLTVTTQALCGTLSCICFFTETVRLSTASQTHKYLAVSP